MGKNNKTRIGGPADIARLDFHDWCGRLIDRTKGKTTEKDKGLMMMERIENRFGITAEERQRFREEAMKEIEEDFKELRGRKLLDIGYKSIKEPLKPLKK